MTREQQYWEDTQEALNRVFDRCEEIDLQSGYDMLEDIQFIRGFINKHKPRTEKQEPILDKIRAKIDSLERFEIRGEKTPLINGDNVLRIIDKYKAESEIDNDNY